MPNLAKLRQRYPKLCVFPQNCLLRGFSTVPANLVSKTKINQKQMRFWLKTLLPDESSPEISNFHQKKLTARKLLAVSL
jgi:hypothetical protein